MKATKKSTLQFILPYAIGLLIVRLLIDILIKQMQWGYQGESYGGLISLFVALAFIFITIKNYKDFENGGTLLFSEGVKVGVALLLIVGVIFSIYLVIHGKYIDPGYQERLTQEAIEKLSLNNPNVNTDMLKKGESGSLIGLFMSILKYIFIGALGSVISTAFLKSE